MCLQCYFKEQRKENESGVELCQAVPPAVTRSADQQKINLSADCSEDHAQNAAPADCSLSHHGVYLRRGSTETMALCSGLVKIPLNSHQKEL